MNLPNMKLPMDVDRIGVGQHREAGFPVLFHRGRVKLSRKFRVWPVPGDDRFMELDPSEFVEQYEVVQQYKPEAKEGAA